MLRPADRRAPDEGGFGKACDVWAATVSLYFMVFGQWPFSEEQVGAWAHTPRDQWHDDNFLFRGVPQHLAGPIGWPHQAHPRPEQYSTTGMMWLWRGVWAAAAGGTRFL